MNPKLRQIADQISKTHPNLIRKLLKSIKEQLPLGLGEGKIKAALAGNIAEWIYDLDENELKEFIETLQKDPDFYRFLKFQIAQIENYVYEE